MQCAHIRLCAARQTREGAASKLSCVTAALAASLAVARSSGAVGVPLATVAGFNAWHAETVAEMTLALERERAAEQSMHATIAYSQSVICAVANGSTNLVL